MQRQHTKMGFVLAVSLGLGLVLAAPAALAEIYSWRTEDGVYAYTDDPDQVPARYASQVRVVKSRSLASYARFTPQDDAATQRYAGRLADRLAHLRALNAAPQPTAAVAGTASAVAMQGSLSLATGDPNAPRIEMPVGHSGNGPVVVERVNAKRTGDLRTRRVTVVRQGGETLAVLKGSPRNPNPATDIYDEDELESGAPLH